MPAHREFALTEYSVSVDARKRANCATDAVDGFVKINHGLYVEIPLFARVGLALTNAFYWVLAWKLLRSTGMFDDSQCARDLCRSHAFHVLLVFGIASASTAYHFYQLGLDREISRASRSACDCFKFRGFTLPGTGTTSKKVKASPLKVTSLRQLSDERVGFDRLRSDSARDLSASAACSPSPTKPSVTTMSLYNYPGELVRWLCAMDIGCAIIYGVFCATCFGAEKILSAGRLPTVFLVTAMICQRAEKYWAYVVLHSIWHALSAALMLDFLLAQ